MIQVSDFYDLATLFICTGRYVFSAVASANYKQQIFEADLYI